MKTVSRLLLLLVLPLAATAQTPAGDTAVQSADNVYVADGLVYYSLRENRVVPADERDKSNWDILINGVEVHANRAGLILEQDFTSVKEAPLEGMGRGIMKTASGDTWYHYDMDSHFITPKDNRTMVLQLPDDTYAKIEIQSYYHRITDEPRYMSFRFVIQHDGSRTFPR